MRIGTAPIEGSHRERKINKMPSETNSQSNSPTMRIGTAPMEGRQKEREQPIKCHPRQTVKVTHLLLKSEQHQWKGVKKRENNQ
jgi:hypothetical protein